MSDAPWLAALRRAADAPPLRPRVPLRAGPAGAHTIGSVEPELAVRLAATGAPIAAGAAGASGAWLVAGDVQRALERIAHALHALGAGGRWRDEQLAVTDTESGARIATIERAAVRPLGIHTFAVHLVGRAHDGRWWVQQRAHDKATDPGLWDTLMGGMQAADESDADTLERETWEEAGLRLADLQGLRPLTRFTVRRPVPQGWLVEHTHVFEAVLPPGAVPRNLDGEVAGFDCLARDTLVERLAAGAFTLEAALALAASLAGVR